MAVSRRTALITGATAGIGAAFARRLAADGYALVLVARDAQRLRATARDLDERHGVPVEALPANLTDEDGLAAVETRLADSTAPVDLLVNNAGMSLNRDFLQASAADQERLLRLNVHAVMRLTRAALPGMVQRRQGGIINVSSVAGFGPVMPGSTYPASKAWVNNFTASIAPTVREHGVRVMAVCPGFVRTEFHARAGIDMSWAPRWIWVDADVVAAKALRHLARGRICTVVDWRYRVAVALMRVIPRRIVQAVARDSRRH